MSDFKIVPLSKIKSNLLRNLKNIVKKHLNKTVIDGVAIMGYNGKKIKTCKISLDDGTFLRFDRKNQKEITRLQMMAVENGIEIPKVVLCVRGYKFSEWIDGFMLRDVCNIGEAYIKFGEVVARLNNVKDPRNNNFLQNADINSTNVIWTEDKKIYIIDHGKLKTSPRPDTSVRTILLKRISEKERIDAFLKGYSKYRNIDKIIELLDKHNWRWKDRILRTNMKPLQY